MEVLLRYSLRFKGVVEPTIFVMYRKFKFLGVMAALCVPWLPLQAQEDAVPVKGGAKAVEMVTGAVDADRRVLPMEEVVRRVREASPAALIERETVRRALEQSYRRRAALLPQLSGRAEQSRRQLGRGFSGGSLDSPPFNSFDARIEASQVIFDADLYADYRLAKLEHAIAELNYEVAIQDILEQAIMLYFTQLRDIRRIEIVEGNIARERELLQLAQEQFEAGTAVKIDVTRAEVRVARERRALMEARTDAEDSLLQLKALLDLPLDAPVLLDRSLIDGINAPPSLKRYGSMETLTELRPELEGRQRQVDQAILERKAAGWRRLPNVELFADWGYDSDEPFDGREGEAWMLGVRATIPIFEGFRISAEKREAQAAVRQNEQRLRQLRNRIEREFTFALTAMDSRYEQIEIARDEIRLGREEVEQARERYREGLADNRELIDAQQRLAEAEDSHLRAIYLYGLSRLAFARAIGKTERVLE